MDPSAPGELAKNTPKRKEEALSNAMRTSKRTLAGVAAAALTAGLIPFAVVTAATSANAATATATVDPVRPTGTVSPLSIPAASMNWTGTSSLASGTLSLTTAPTASAIFDAGDDTATLAQTGTIAVATGDDSSIDFNVDTAGTYSGSIFDGTDTVSFSFTTVGTPTSMTLTPDTQTVLVGGPATLTVTLKDANGNTTQPSSVDTIAVSDNTDDTVSPASITANDIADGTATVTLDTTGNAAGTTTITATPQGTLPGTGVAAVTATVVKSGTVASDAIAGIAVTAPANAVASGSMPTPAASVPEGTTSVTVTIDDTTAAAAGNRIRLGINSSAGTVNGGSYVTGDDTLYVDLTTDADKKASVTLTLGGSAILDTEDLIVQQVDVANAQVGGVQLTVTQNAPSVVVTASPDDSAVAALGASTDVQVTVEDQFGTALSGWVVSAFRGANTSGTFLTQATTSTSGVATVAVTNASGAVAGDVEQYSFSARPPVGGATNANNLLQITYTADGSVTSLSVAVSGTSVTDPITDTTTSVTTAPVVGVPADGTADSQSAGSFTVATGVDVAAATGDMTEFAPTATPLNNVTVTAPEGLFVSTDSATAWDEGESSVTVSSGTSVYVFGLTVGTYDVTFSSGGKTVTAPVKITTSANNAYNIAVTPETQSVATGAIGNATLSVSDVFGNPVAGAGITTGDDTGAVTVNASGAILLAGFNTTQNLATGADGTATITFIAGNAAGTGTLAALPKAGSPTPAWQSGYTPPTNAPAPVTSAAATVTVGSGPTSQSIIIAGERQNRSIIVDGVTQGIADGTVVRPWIKFPGQTEYTQGTAQRMVEIFDPAEELGEFEGQRRTG